ncbi:26S proteasome regulatory subunit 6B [Bagarius yarrelli]|uniref:26S proteasome regulatory subunit 6B n=1 Tax=Bagarius yarrelli TaxID=175774 RepID=A0A556VVZ9_BAGYA|nr:26S proteasome regulatory subunit 6B [Bagarius yarrelli]
MLSSRPHTALSFLAPEPEDLEDLYSRYKKLQQELEFLEVQEEYIKDEQKNLKKEFLHAQEEVKRIQSIPLVIGQFLEAVDQNTAIVGSTTGSNYYVRILSTIDRELLKPNASVALHKHSNALVDVLPPEADSSIMMLTSDQKPDVMYADIGGMDIQKQEVREAVELPLTHFELYKQIGIDPPRGVLMYGPPGCGKTMLAKAVAHHTTAAFIRVVGSEFVQKYLGEGPRMVRDVFRLAKENAPAIIFIDEIDAIATKRFDAQTGDVARPDKISGADINSICQEGYQKRVTYFFRIFRKLDLLSGSWTGHGTNQTGGADVYANLSQLVLLPKQQDMHYCPKQSPLLGGPIHISFPSGLTLAQVRKKNPLVVRGGRYRPPDCEPRHRTAIIIPHRNREQHLKYLLYYLHPFLQRQQLSYSIYVIHQAGDYTFNRAKLMNIGFREAMREEDWDCLFFHDVDLIPEDDRNIYTCDKNPKHAAVAMDKFGYKSVRHSTSSLDSVDVFKGAACNSH